MFSFVVYFSLTQYLFPVSTFLILATATDLFFQDPLLPVALRREESRKQKCQGEKLRAPASRKCRKEAPVRVTEMAKEAMARPGEFVPWRPKKGNVSRRGGE